VNPSARPLSIEEIEQLAVMFKENLTRDCERMVRRNDNAGALAAIHGKEYIDQFVYTLKVRSGSQLGLPARARPIQLNAARLSRGRKRENE
jgi:hypothetical protein